MYADRRELLVFRTFSTVSQRVETVFRHAEREAEPPLLILLARFDEAVDLRKERVGIKKTIRDYVPDEADFLARLDEMTEQAFDDQCTGANPRYPLMSEIKGMYLNAYYGKHDVI